MSDRITTKFVQERTHTHKHMHTKHFRGPGTQTQLWTCADSMRVFGHVEWFNTRLNITSRIRWVNFRAELLNINNVLFFFIFLSVPPRYKVYMYMFWSITQLEKYLSNIRGLYGNLCKDGWLRLVRFEYVNLVCGFSLTIYSQICRS